MLQAGSLDKLATSIHIYMFQVKDDNIESNGDGEPITEDNVDLVRSLWFAPKAHHRMHLARPSVLTQQNNQGFGFRKKWITWQSWHVKHMFRVFVLFHNNRKILPGNEAELENQSVETTKCPKVPPSTSSRKVKKGKGADTNADA